MKSSYKPDKPVRRRDLLTSVVAAGALLGLGGQAAGQTYGGEEASDPPLLESFAGLARLRDYKSCRASSYDRSGGNADHVPIEPGQTVVLMDVTGAGVITHIWFTIDSSDRHHLKKLVLRAYWDGEANPSVEVPIGDFFGLGLGEYFPYESALTNVASARALNAYFPMPFSTSARLTVSNEGAARTNSFYFNLDYVSLPERPRDVGYFHAQYRQATPCLGWTDDWTTGGEPLVRDKKNLTGEGNYVFLEASGRGHLVGLTQAVLQNQDGWFGEGDEMIFVDDQREPAIIGTGTEDYYNGAWGFYDGRGAPFAYAYSGAPYIADSMRIGGRYCLYRWHVESPISFQKSLRVTMEHGHANNRSDNFFSTAYWYQAEPHALFPALPPPEARVPRIFQVGGSGPAALPGKK